MKSIIIQLVVISVLVGCTSLEKPEDNISENKIVRKGAIIKIRNDKLEFYKELHANPWKGVNDMLKKCNIQNYSIYYRDGYLFSYMEYTGENWDEDMKKMAADSTTQAWWELTDPCQEPVPSASEGEWWAGMEEVYHLD